MINYLLLISLLFLASCREVSKNGAQIEEELPMEKVLKTDENQNYDSAISTWYIYQYSAIEELEKITMDSVGVGNKTTDSPRQILEKQKSLALKYCDKSGLNKSLGKWAEQQEFCAEKLFFLLKKEFIKNTSDATPLATALYYIDLQNDVLAELEQ